MALHGERTNEVVQVDFLYLGSVKESDLKYFLMVKDDVSSYKTLHPWSNANSNAAVSRVSTQILRFGTMEWLETDQGCRFKTLSIKKLATERRIKHLFTTTYCSWANETVEQVCREIVRISRALLSDWKLSVR